MFGKPIAAVVLATSVPSASVGYLLGGIGMPFVTHSTSDFINADRIGAEGAGFMSKSHPPKTFVTAAVVVAKPPGPPPCVTPGKKYRRTFSGSGMSALAS